ncbi:MULTISPECIES: hypothetical protein [unclassified Curtobacterium]|uniref:hypothetical protein n=1 Tax=unclassified Curtobacterium TaxID=257496 RepID=UPI0039AF7DB2
MNAARGLVKGLQSQQRAIAKQMSGIARSMVATIRSELGIHSPSKVFANDVGRWIPAGMAAGVEGASGVYRSSLDELAGYVPSSKLSSAAAFASTTGVQPVLGDIYVQNPVTGDT